jgi:hypothetical protein
LWRKKEVEGFRMCFTMAPHTYHRRERVEDPKKQQKDEMM